MNVYLIQNDFTLNFSGANLHFGVPQMALLYCVSENRPYSPISSIIQPTTNLTFSLLMTSHLGCHQNQLQRPDYPILQTNAPIRLVLSSSIFAVFCSVCFFCFQFKQSNLIHIKISSTFWFIDIYPFHGVTVSFPYGCPNKWYFKVILI